MLRIRKTQWHPLDDEHVAMAFKRALGRDGRRGKYKLRKSARKATRRTTCY